MSQLPAHRLKQAKRALRRAVLARRDALPPHERAARGERIVERTLELPEVVAASTVMGFWSFGSEVDTAPLIERLHAAGTRVVLPRIEDGELVAARYAPGDPVTTTPFGAGEPTGLEVALAEEVDVVITPGVVFDARGRRIGYGGGFYDRFLPRLRPGAPAIAIAFALQVVDDAPEGGMDRRVDVIVTEDEVIRCQPG
ncbi:MAG: 5-formyltetrahydrofolate cyclo-ligase [Actinomycetota bacterium]